MTEQIHASAGLDLREEIHCCDAVNRYWLQRAERRFERTDSGLLNLKEWTIEHNCDVVACESTSDFWVPIYTMMEGQVTVIIGNARDIKMFSHKRPTK